MGSSRSTSTQTSTGTTTQNPWGPAQGLATEGAGILDRFLSSPNANSVYSGPRTVGPSSLTDRALAMAGSGAGAADSQRYLSGVLNGSGSNPQLQSLQDAIQRRITAATNAQFSRTGMTGGTQHQESLARGLTEGLAQPLFQAYENDQSRRMSAASLLPQVEAGRMEQLLNAGQVREGYDRERIAADRQQFEENRLAPIRGWSDVSPYAMQLAGLGGTSTTDQSSTTTQRQQTPLAQQIIGGALMGASFLNPVSSVFNSGLIGGMRGMMGGGGLTGFQQGYAGMHSPSFWQPTTTYGG